VGGKNTSTTKGKTETLSKTSKEFGQYVNAEKTKCMFIYHHQKERQNINIQITIGVNL
jgi:hypothetical protein